MIVIVAKIIVSEKNREKFFSVMKPLIEASRKEEGCSDYDLYVDIEKETKFTLIEKWTEQDALDLHNESEHFKSAIPILGELSDSLEIVLNEPAF